MAIVINVNKAQVTFNSVRQKCLAGVDESVDMLRELVAGNEEPATKVKAAQALVVILTKVADISISEQLPLLEELEELARKKAA